MKFLNYEELVNHLKQQPTQEDKIGAIIQYFIDNVEYDYVMIEHINKIVTPDFAIYADRLFPPNTANLKEKALNFMRNSSNISNAYWYRLRNLYLNPKINDDGSLQPTSMIEALNSMGPEIIKCNGLLKKGTSQHIAEFAKMLCSEINIPALIVSGISSGEMPHYWLDIYINGQELFYDISYALYIRDNFCRIGLRYKQEEWLGITPKQLYKNQCTRKILHPKGFDLKELGLNDLPLNMKNFFDTVF